MYAKLFSRITESSIIEESITTRWVFVAMLAIADIDGTVIGTDVAIARRINVPLDDFKEALKVLMSKDDHSNNQDYEGRRILPSTSERGYFLTGYSRYRDLKDEEDRRQYMKEYMRLRREQKRRETSDNKQVKKPVNFCKLPLAQLTHIDTEADTAKNKDKSKLMDVAKAPSTPCAEDFINELKEFYPNIDMEKQLRQMKAWLLTPKGRGRKLTKRFMVNWLNRCDSELQTNIPTHAGF